MLDLQKTITIFILQNYIIIPSFKLPLHNGSWQHLSNSSTCPLPFGGHPYTNITSKITHHTNEYNPNTTYNKGYYLANTKHPFRHRNDQLIETPTGERTSLRVFLQCVLVFCAARVKIALLISRHLYAFFKIARDRYEQDVSNEIDYLSDTPRIKCVYVDEFGFEFDRCDV